MPLPENPDETGNAGRPASQTPRSGASVATLNPQSMHAVALLKAEHREVETMFGSMRETGDVALRLDIAKRVVQMLHVHMQVEEELFYPAVERATALDPGIAHARHEHDEIRSRLADVSGAGEDGGAIDAAIAALESCVTNHVRDEEAGLLPRLDRVDMDWTEVGIAMAERAEALRRGE